jgi:hypothetical protein
VVPVVYTLVDDGITWVRRTLGLTKVTGGRKATGDLPPAEEIARVPVGD